MAVQTVAIKEAFNTTIGAAAKNGINATNEFKKTGEFELMRMQRELTKQAFDKWYASFEDELVAAEA